MLFLVVVGRGGMGVGMRREGRGMRIRMAWSEEGKERV